MDTPAPPPGQYASGGRAPPGVRVCLAVSLPRGDAGGTVRLYINGTEGASIVLKESTDEVCDVWSIGGRGGGGENLRGCVHEMRIYDREHGAAEVTATTDELRVKWNIAAT